MQGLPDSFNSMNMLLNSIPRDHDFDSILMTTIDKNKDNNRQKGRMKLVKGFSLYMVLTGKNFAYEGKTEERYRTMLIVCNVQVSHMVFFWSQSFSFPQFQNTPSHPAAQSTWTESCSTLASTSTSWR